MKAYLTPAEAAKEIRAELKAGGISQRMVSIRAESYSMGSTIHCRIKQRGITVERVERIANAQRNVRYCEATGEILSGGNRFVDVEYSRELIKSVEAEIEDRLPRPGDGETTIVNGWKVFQNLRERDEWRAVPPEDIDVRPLVTYGRNMLLKQLAIKLLDGLG